MDNTKTLELIAQLLRKAESTTPAEAEALTEHAERLAVRHGIEQARIEAALGAAGKTTRQGIVTRKIQVTGRLRQAEVTLYASVGIGLGTVRCLQINRRDHVEVWLVGYADDVARAEMIAGSLRLQAATALRVWWTDPGTRVARSWMTDHERFKARRTYVMAFGDGAGDRMLEHRLTVERGITGTGTALVLADRGAAVDRHIEEHVGRVHATRALAHDGAAAERGYRDGQDAATGERALGSRRAVTAGD